MLFLFRKKTIVLDLFTNDAAAFEYAKPAVASRFHPEWWKRLPKSIPTDLAPSPTMKTCAGFIDLYRHGFMFPMWSDLFLRVENNFEFTWKYSDSYSYALYHKPEEAGNLFFESKVRNIKLHNPWLASSKEDVYWMLHQPVWSQDLQRDLIIPPAVVNFKHQNTTAINILIADMDRPRELIIPFGLPMVHYIPIDDRPIDLKLHLVTQEEFNRIGQKNNPRSFLNAYRKKIAATKEQSNV